MLNNPKLINSISSGMCCVLHTFNQREFKFGDIIYANSIRYRICDNSQR